MSETTSDPGLIQHKLRLLMELRRCAISDARVLGAIEKTPRERFIPPAFADQAYENVALPIEHGQTVSQPYVVALMTEKLELGERHKVLEIGTGSGYQTAVLARLARRVFTIERHRELLRDAQARLEIVATDQHCVPIWRRHQRLAGADPLRSGNCYRGGDRYPRTSHRWLSAGRGIGSASGQRSPRPTVIAHPSDRRRLCHGGSRLGAVCPACSRSAAASGRRGLTCVRARVPRAMETCASGGAQGGQ